MDPVTMTVINEFRFEDPDQYKTIVEQLQKSIVILETLGDYGYDKAAEMFDLESVDMEGLGSEKLTVEDILRAKEEDS
jgi:hypothetical protein